MSEPLRILDMGAHDGFVGAWARERFEGELVIDGIELHPDACQRARRRGYRKVVQGRAEEAPRLLKGEFYDAVVIYELLEHVPDMDALLSAAESMLSSGGLVFCSTPDGTFGLGRNPHHLRALRAIDLADLLRRRGRLEEMEVGADGITAASYRPAERKGEIAIYTGRGFTRWSPMDIVTKGLGGSETAAVRLAFALSELGHIVTVYGDVEQGCFRNVVFRDWQAFDPTVAREALISSRLPEVFDWPVNAERKLLWLHDVDCGERLTPARAEQLDQVLVLSGWHEQHVAAAYPFLNGKLARIRNGLDLERFEKGEPPARECRVVYTSSPDRGLDILLELWPEVRKQVPDAELAHAYPPYFEAAAQLRPELAAFRDRLAGLRKQDGVTALGSLSQPQLAELLRASLVWAHPSWATPYEGAFNETSCIGAMEAQAAGCVLVASKWGAIPETAKGAALLVPAHDAPGQKWRQHFVRNLVKALTSDSVQRTAQQRGPKAVAQLGWDGVAEQVAALVECEAS